MRVMALGLWVSRESSVVVKRVRLLKNSFGPMMYDQASCIQYHVLHMSHNRQSHTIPHYGTSLAHTLKATHSRPFAFRPSHLSPLPLPLLLPPLGRSSRHGLGYVEEDRPCRLQARVLQPTTKSYLRIGFSNSYIIWGLGIKPPCV